MVDYTGEPLEERKQIYAQAFAVYALVEYHRATGRAEALDRATRLFDLLETYSFDPVWGGYYEAFSRDWEPLDTVRLSDRDPNEKKSMNTHLHVMEAYTNLYRVWEHEPLATRLRRLLEHFLEVIVDPDTAHVIPFFTEQWERRSASISPGHDIEASWLLQEAANVLGDAELEARTRENAVRMARVTLREGVDDDDGLIFEAEPDRVTDPDRHWWPQAEAVVGFLNAYQISDEDRFREAALNSWAFIQQHLVDRKHGEWRRRVSPNGTHYGDDKVGPWKGPYHGVRACLEGVRRVGEMTDAPDAWPEHVGTDLAAALDGRLESSR
jgi:mannobiose 2-epimerase